MSALVVIDSHIFIWGIKGQAIDDQRDNIPKGKSFIEWLGKNKYKILLPVPQLVELLSYVPVEQQEEIRQYIDERFLIVPFDNMAASKCAELLYLSLNEPELVEYRKVHSVPKTKIKYDCMIVAIAIVRGASRIYSEDSDLKKFAHGQIDVLPLPNISTQGVLPYAQLETQKAENEENDQEETPF